MIGSAIYTLSDRRGNADTRSAGRNALLDGGVSADIKP